MPSGLPGQEVDRALEERLAPGNYALVCFLPDTSDPEFATPSRRGWWRSSASSRGRQVRGNPYPSRLIPASIRVRRLSWEPAGTFRAAWSPRVKKGGPE